jgi:hypothetical protein
MQKLKTAAFLRIWALLVLVSLQSVGAPAKHGVLAWNFDWDDNIMFMKTKIAVFKKGTKEEKEVSTGAFAEIRQQLGVAGTEWADWEERKGRGLSYRNFQDKRGTNNFLNQILEAMQDPPSQWQGPSWGAFVEACSRRETVRYVTIITARGHSPFKIHAALKKMQAMGLIKFVPPLKNLIPVDNPKFQTEEDTSTRKAHHMKRLLDEISLKPVRGGQVIDQDNKGKAQLHLWGFSDDDFGNFERAKKELGDAIKEAKAAKSERWKNIKIVLFYTGTKKEGVEPHAVVLDSNGDARDFTAAELGEAKWLMGDVECEHYFDWLQRAVLRRAQPPK